MNTIHVWTIQMAKWRIAKEREIHLLDTTAKSGHSEFAPDFGVVMAYKAGQVSEAQYTDIYYARMRKSYRENRNKWDMLKEYPRLAIACYCKPGAFCHRHLFVDIIGKIFEFEKVPMVLECELI